MENTFYKEVLLSLADGVYVVDLNRKILFWNKAAEKLTGYGAAEVLGRRCEENVLCHISAEGKELCANGCPLKSTIQDGTLAEATVFLHNKKGHRLPVTIKTSPLKDETGHIIGAVEFFSLVTSRERVLKEFEKLHNEAFQDRLTGIGNRRFGENTLENIFHRSIDEDSSYGVLFVDIDHFKHVNDTWGHSTGDDVLRMVANSLNSGLRAFDSVSRWGGEEFLLILPNCNINDLSTVGERLRMLVEKSWLDYEGTIIKVTASFGGVIANNDEDVHSLLQRADKQMYLSKKNGRNMVSIDR